MKVLQILFICILSLMIVVPVFTLTTEEGEFRKSTTEP